MQELSVAERGYQVVLAVVSDGETVTDVAARFGVARKTVHARRRCSYATARRMYSFGAP